MSNLEEEIYKSVDDMSIEIKPTKQTNFILAQFAEKYKPEELTLDGIPNIDTQLKEMKVLDDEIEEKREKEDKTKRYNREMTNRVKCLSLDKMNKSIFTNTLHLSMSERRKLQEIMHTYNDIEHDVIIKEFNSLTCDLLDDVNKLDYSKLAVYSI